ncbi:sigma-70 family RNA polymerase sigma factor [Nocardia wallacei]|uniref:sigma-70 family RNA polymerase sigma factor n=1 Tax=Nocardia wallacei TaxID=480035 RepID=UPI002456454A|nr:sigma-70 family RNA polymerase sigma factor [Nocardia wallacei]
MNEVSTAAELLVQDPRPRLADLLAATGNGDRDAFAVFYRHTSHRVFGLALSMMRNPATAEDVAQEVYIQVWSLAGRYDPRMSSPVGWLMMLTHRRVVDRIRADRAAAGRESVFGQVQTGRSHDVVSETVEQHLDEQAVRRCLHTLTALQRESIVLAYYGGLTYLQVSERLQTPLATVKARIREGLKRLAAGLAESGTA